MSVMTVTSRITKEVDVSSEYDISEFNNCVRHNCKPIVIEFTYGSRKNKDRCTRCPMDKTYECSVYGLKSAWNKWNPNLNTEFIENLDRTVFDWKTGKTTYFFVKPNPRIKEDFWERWEITV